MQNKKSFVFYCDWEQNCERLSVVQKGELFSAIVAFGARGEDLSESLDEVTAMCFSFMKSQMERDREKYQAVSEQRARCGAMGGRPKKQEKQDKQENEQSKISKCFSDKPKKPDNVTVNVNEDEYENENENEHENKPQPPKTIPAVNERFERFWSEYPKKENKVRAMQAFEALSPDDRLLEQIIISVRDRRKTEGWQKSDGRFVPSAANYLSERRFEDSLNFDPPGRQKSYDFADVLKILKK